MNRRALLALTASLVAVLAFPPATQAVPNNLERAFNELRTRRYSNAQLFANRHLAAQPTSFKAKYIVAVSDCGLRQGMTAAKQRLRRFIVEYRLTEAEIKQVLGWLDKCPPPPPPSAANSVEEEAWGSSSSEFLTAAPAITGSSPEPARRSPSDYGQFVNISRAPRMGPLLRGVDFFGQDYARSVTDSVFTCVELCRADNNCRAMTYVVSGKVCWLKGSLPTARRYGADYLSARKMPPTAQ